MKCTSCGSEMKNNKVCHVCGATATLKTEQERKTYTGLNENEAPVHKRSRAVALLMACIGGNDLYLFYFSRFFWKMAVLLFTFGIGYLIWQIIDIITIAVGGMKYDAHGNPVEW